MAEPSKKSGVKNFNWTEEEVALLMKVVLDYKRKKIADAQD